MRVMQLAVRKPRQTRWIYTEDHNVMIFLIFFLMAIIKIKELGKKMSSLCKCVNGCAFW